MWSTGVIKPFITFIGIATDSHNRSHSDSNVMMAQGSACSLPPNLNGPNENIVFVAAGKFYDIYLEYGRQDQNGDFQLPEPEDVKDFLKLSLAEIAHLLRHYKLLRFDNSAQLVNPTTDVINRYQGLLVLLDEKMSRDPKWRTYEVQRSEYLNLIGRIREILIMYLFVFSNLGLLVADRSNIPALDPAQVNEVMKAFFTQIRVSEYAVDIRNVPERYRHPGQTTMTFGELQQRAVYELLDSLGTTRATNAAACATLRTTHYHMHRISRSCADLFRDYANKHSIVRASIAEAFAKVFGLKALTLAFGPRFTVSIIGLRLVPFFAMGTIFLLVYHRFYFFRYVRYFFWMQPTVTGSSTKAPAARQLLNNATGN